MKRKIRFVKMHSLGNDFVILDRIAQEITLDQALLARIGHRQLGIGCDQILIVDPPTQPQYDFQYRVFNADGQEAGQCGNGARCFGRYVFEKGLTDKRKLNVGCLHNPISIDLTDPQHIEVCLGKPQLPPTSNDIDTSNLQKISEGRYKLPLNAHNATVEIEKEVSLLSIGNPHCVITVPSVKDAKVNTTGKSLQTHPSFPKGVNVGFKEVLARNHIKLRVYERGVGETSACGTAACAAVIAGNLQNELNPAVQVDMPGGALSVRWEEKTGIYISGPTHLVYEGWFVIEHADEFATQPPSAEMIDEMFDN